MPPRLGPRLPRRASLLAVLCAVLLGACADLPVVVPGDGTAPSFSAPQDTLPRRPVDLPDGIEVRPGDYVPTEELDLGDVSLPSGRIVAGEILFDAEPLEVLAHPGSHPARATLVRYLDDEFESVALLTLELASAPTTQWASAGSFAVDGGTATITSVETRDHLNGLFDRSEEDWMALHSAIFTEVERQDYLATRIELGPELSLVISSSGVGDGAYPIYVGFDDSGQPTQVVLDFLLLELAWPDA